VALLNALSSLGRFLSLPARQWRVAVAVAFAMLSGSARPATAASNVSLEYQVKAAYLFNFARFVRWPDTAFAAPDSPFVIGVIGQNPFGEFLKGEVDGRTIEGRPVEVRVCDTPEQAAACHIVFIPHSAGDRLASLLSFLRGKHVLTVGEDRSFIRGGGLVNFFLRNDTVQFEINLDAAEEEGFDVSSQMLQFAKIAKKRSR
jgi:hypothetical protein